MLNYLTVGSNRLEEAKAFYDALLGPIGMTKAFDQPEGGRIYGAFGKSAFGVLKPRDGQPATVANGATIGFEVDSLEALADFHARALSLGGTNEGEPGPRGGEGSTFHFAYVRDLDGHKLCAYHIVKS